MSHLWSSGSLDEARFWMSRLARCPSPYDRTTDSSSSFVSLQQKHGVNDPQRFVSLSSTSPPTLSRSKYLCSYRPRYSGRWAPGSSGWLACSWRKGQRGNRGICGKKRLSITPDNSIGFPSHNYRSMSRQQVAVEMSRRHGNRLALIARTTRSQETPVLRNKDFMNSVASPTQLIVAAQLSRKLKTTTPGQVGGPGKAFSRVESRT